MNLILPKLLDINVNLMFSIRKIAFESIKFDPTFLHQVKPQDPDLDGPKEEELIPDKLAKTDKPLEEAIRFLKPLQMLAAKNIFTHVTAYQVYSRKGKLLLMMQAVKRGHQLQPTAPAMHECIVRFLKTGKLRNFCRS